MQAFLCLCFLCLQPFVKDKYPIFPKLFSPHFTDLNAAVTLHLACSASSCMRSAYPRKLNNSTIPFRALNSNEGWLSQ
jgi:hypothetical protein